MSRVTLILIILVCLALLTSLTRIAWTHHRDALEAANVRAREAHAAARILGDHIIEMISARDSAIYARDFYRAALNDIISSTDNTDPAGQIARRFINYEKNEGRGESS